MDLTAFDILLLFFVIGGAVWGAVTGIRVVGPFAVILALITLVYGYPQISAAFGTAAGIQPFLMLLLLAFAVLLLSGLVIRALLAAVQASGLGGAIGALLGCFMGAIAAGALVWWLKSHGTPHVDALLSASVLAPALEEFFTTIVSFTVRLLPSIELRPGEPWWRTLWSPPTRSRATF